MKKLALLLFLVPVLGLSGQLYGPDSHLYFPADQLDPKTCKYIGSSSDEKMQAVRLQLIPNLDQCGRQWWSVTYGISCDGSKTRNCLPGASKTLTETYPNGKKGKPKKKKSRPLKEQVKLLKAECTELGFKPGTEKFKNCVVELM